MINLQEVLRDCSNMLDSRNIEVGLALRMRSPLVSAFIGKEAVLNKGVVERTYRDCWGSNVDKLSMLDDGDFSIDTISKHAGEMLAEGSGVFCNQDRIMLVWYWDIMDTDFEQRMAEIVNVAGGFPLGIEVSECFFVFCKQFTSSNRKLTEERLKKLIDWAKENKKVLVVQSDVTYDGIFNDSTIWKSYRGAANCAVIMNTQTDDHTGSYLEHRIVKSGVSVWSIGSCTMNKSSEEIAAASFKSILREYQSVHISISDADNGMFDAKSRLTGERTGTYQAFFDSLIKQWQLLPDMPNCISALPYTEQMKSYLKDPFVRKLFKKSSNEIDLKKREAAIASISDFWKLFMDEYYNSKINSRDDENWMEAGLMSILSERFTVAEMKAHFNNEAAELRAAKWNSNMLTKSQTSGACESLHELACNELLNDIYKRLAETLAASFEALAHDASGFDAIIKNVDGALNQLDFDSSIVSAYGNHIRELISKDPRKLFSIHPCGTSDELIAQIKSVFIDLAANDEVFKYNLMQDIRFRGDTNGRNQGAVTVLQDFFNVDMNTTGALKLFSATEGRSYCLINNSDGYFANGIAGETVGTFFGIPGSNYIDRLYIYPVNPSQIIY